MPPIIIIMVIFIEFHALHMEVKHLQKELEEEQWKRDLDDFKRDICSFFFLNSVEKLLSEKRKKS